MTVDPDEEPCKSGISVTFGNGKSGSIGGGQCIDTAAEKCEGDISAYKSRCPSQENSVKCCCKPNTTATKSKHF